MKYKYFQAQVATTGHSTRNSITTPESLRRIVGGEGAIREERGGANRGGEGAIKEIGPAIRGGEIGGNAIREGKGEETELERPELKRGGGVLYDGRDDTHNIIHSSTQHQSPIPSRLIHNQMTSTEKLIDKLKKSNNNNNNYEQHQYHQQHRRQWNERLSDSQDSGVASETQQQSNRSTGVTRPRPPIGEALTTPTGPLTHSVFPVVPPFFNSTVPNVAPLRRKDILPNIDLGGDEGISRWKPLVGMETGGVTKPFPKRIPGDTENIHFSSSPSYQQHSKLPGILDKKEAANFYKKSARYSPAVSGKNSRVGFGSSAPRFINDTPSPVSAVMRPLGRPRGVGEHHGTPSSSSLSFMHQPPPPLVAQRGVGRNDHHIIPTGMGGRGSQWNYNSAAAPSQTGIISYICTCTYFSRYMYTGIHF